MKKLTLNENFISRIWEEPSYYSDLRTTKGEGVKVLDYGRKNFDAGPDYKNARIIVGDVTYTGSIEIHRSLKEWFEHDHKRNDKYNDLVLQVVMWDDDRKVNETDQPRVKRSRYIPTVILSRFLTGSIHDIWREIIETPSEKFRLPCYPENLEIEDEIKYEWIDELSMKRLRYKISKMKERLPELGEINKKSCWERMIFEFTCEALGYSKNKEQFVRLARLADPAYIKKLNPRREEVDAMLFGLAGFLKDLRFKDEYISHLKMSWEKLQKEMREEPLHKSIWNFFRLRPANFPTLRIAYASGLLYEMIYSDLFKRIVRTFQNSSRINHEIERMFKNIEVSDYWHLHYNFGIRSRRGKVSREPASHTVRGIIGTERVNDIITNMIIPVILLYSGIFHDNELEEKALDLYKNTGKKSVSNEISRVMEMQLNVKAGKAYRAQGLIQLHNFYCIEGQCKSCRIGNLVFKEDMAMEPLKIILY